MPGICGEISFQATRSDFPFFISTISRWKNGAPAACYRRTCRRSPKRERRTLIQDIERGRHGPYTLDPKNTLVGELLIVGAAGSLVATVWLGHQNARRPINETATAGAVLGPHWGRILAIALENAKQATDPIPAADAPAHSLVANTPVR